MRLQMNSQSNRALDRMQESAVSRLFQVGQHPLRKYLCYTLTGILAAALCGCGYTACRDIHVRLSPPAVGQTRAVESREQLNQISEILGIADGVFERHGLDCVSQPVSPQAAQQERPFVVRECTFSKRHDAGSRRYVVPIFTCNVLVNGRDERIDIHLRTQADLGSGTDKEFDVVFSELVTNLTERIGADRMRVQKRGIPFFPCWE
jgi:hypothetical protein